MSFYPKRLAASLAILLLSAGMAFSTAFAADKAQSFTGEVSDAMCGAKHMMEGSATDCTRACVSKGSAYALVVGDKVYTLKTQDKAALDQLNQLAGRKVQVKGTASGDTIEVSSVAPGQ